ncbi:MAG TPA: hypothetical protein VGE94_03585 [Chloroflexota bacterium]
MLLDVRQMLTPADHQTHRRYAFRVPPDCPGLAIRVAYAPKFLESDESVARGTRALDLQARDLAERVGPALAAAWTIDQGQPAPGSRIPNLVTMSLDDADGVYRGAGHRHAADQRLFVGHDTASPGLVAGPLPTGEWWLTLSSHTLVTAQCEVHIQIGAESASNRP